MLTQNEESFILFILVVLFPRPADLADQGIFTVSPSPLGVVTGEEDEDQFEAYFKDHHKAIVDRETWERCQERMAAEREKKKKGGRTPIVDGEGVW